MGSKRNIDRKIGVVLCMLDPAESEALARETRTWADSEWELLGDVIHRHGVGPHFGHRLIDDLSWVCPRLSRWLGQQHHKNRLRLERMAGEISEILAAASRAGIGVMPLKGSLLSFDDPLRMAPRPMADLDLLIRHADRTEFDLLLRRLGYSTDHHRPGGEARHWVYHKGAKVVVSRRSEERDNPRPVELHWNITSEGWGAEGCDITEMLWRGSSVQSFLGSQAWVPSDEALLIHVAAHATYHHFDRRGRLIRWLDIARLCQRVDRVGPRVANWIYPSIRFAARGLGHIPMSSLILGDPDCSADRSAR